LQDLLTLSLVFPPTIPDSKTRSYESQKPVPSLEGEPAFGYIYIPP